MRRINLLARLTLPSRIGKSSTSFRIDPVSDYNIVEIRNERFWMLRERKGRDPMIDDKPEGGPAEGCAENSLEIHRLCDEFKQAYRDGQVPRIDDFIASSPEPIRPGLQRALAALVAELSSKGEGPMTETVSIRAGRAEVDEPSASDAAAVLLPSQGGDEMGWIGGYRVIEILGAGGMGIVFRAEDPQLDRSVAIKVIKAGEKDQRLKQRFLREARAMAAIHHDHIVAIYHVGDERGSPFFVMPLLEGESLSQRLKRQPPLSTDEILQIGRETADGLAAAHEKGLIHRDIKPGNLWLEAYRRNPSGFRVKILDFGLARPAEVSDLTGRGAILGTYGFMAPEQLKAEACDARTDLFSLGCVLYQIAAGRPPFEGKSYAAVILSTIEKTPTPLDILRPDLPPSFPPVVNKLLQKDPCLRFDSAGAVSDALRQIERDPTMPSTSSADFANVPTREPVVGPRILDTADRTPSLLRHLANGARPAVAAMVLTALFVCGAAVLVIQSNQQNPTPQKIEKNNSSIAANASDIRPIVPSSEKKHQPSSSDNLSPWDRERAAANWILDIGAEVNIDVDGNRSWLPGSKSDKLPKENFHIREVNLRHNQRVTDNGIEKLKRLKQLEGLSLYGTPVTSKSLAFLQECPHLKILDLGSTRIGDAGMDHLKNLNNIEVLYMGQTQVTDQGLSQLPVFQSLRILGVPPAMTDKGLEHVAKHITLHELVLDFSRVTDQGIRGLSAMTDLGKLELARTSVTDASLETLSKMPRLRDLNLCWTKVQFLSPMSIENWDLKVERLNLEGAPIEDSAVEAFSKLKDLRKLNVNQTRLSENAIRQLRAMLPQCEVIADPSLTEQVRPD